MPVILSQMLEAYRWIGALLVLSAHSTNVFLSLHDIMTAPHSAPVYAWWFAASFELGIRPCSAFSSCRAISSGARCSTASAREGFSARICDPPLRAHLYRVVPALVLTFFADSIGRNVLPNADFYELPMFQAASAPRSSSPIFSIYRRYSAPFTAPTARSGRSPANSGITSAFRADAAAGAELLKSPSLWGFALGSRSFCCSLRRRRGSASAFCYG